MISVSGNLIWQLVRETYLREISHHNSPVGKFSSCKTLQSLACTRRSIEFDEDLTYARRLSASTARTWDLHLKDSAIFLTLLLDILADF
jgi:hypothetical protein